MRKTVEWFCYKALCLNSETAVTLVTLPGTSKRKKNGASVTCDDNKVFHWFSFGNLCYWLLLCKVSVVGGTKQILLSYYSSFYYYNSFLPLTCLAWKNMNFSIPQLQDFGEIWILALFPFSFTLDQTDDWWIANTGWRYILWDSLKLGTEVLFLFTSSPK